MVINGKNITFKMCRNGIFQLTGCKTDSQGEECIKFIWKYIKDSDVYKFADSSAQQLEALFIPAMRNIDFGLGFNVDRQSLDKFFNTQTEYRSLLDPNFGYTGVNIKIPFKQPISKLSLNKIRFDDDTGEWIEMDKILYSDYLKLLTPKERDKKIQKERYHTFLVFHSGKIIMSSLCAEVAEGTYYEFMNIIKDNYKHFQEKLKNESMI